MQAGTRFIYPGGMEGRVDLVNLIAPWPGVEPTFRSLVQRQTTAPPRQRKQPYTAIGRKIGGVLLQWKRKDEKMIEDIALHNIETPLPSTS